jgi:hypothetical protein
MQPNFRGTTGSPTRCNGWEPTNSSASSLTGEARPPSRCSAPSATASPLTAAGVSTSASLPACGNTTGSPGSPVPVWRSSLSSSTCKAASPQRTRRRCQARSGGGTGCPTTPGPGRAANSRTSACCTSRNNPTDATSTSAACGTLTGSTKRRSAAPCPDPATVALPIAHDHPEWRANPRCSPVRIPRSKTRGCS